MTNFRFCVRSFASLVRESSCRVTRDDDTRAKRRLMKSSSWSSAVSSLQIRDHALWYISDMPDIDNISWYHFSWDSYFLERSILTLYLYTSIRIILLPVYLYTCISFNSRYDNQIYMKLVISLQLIFSPRIINSLSLYFIFSDTVSPFEKLTRMVNSSGCETQRNR